MRADSLQKIILFDISHPHEHLNASFAPFTERCVKNRPEFPKNSSNSICR